MDRQVLRQLQLAELEILKDIDRYCRQHKIYYSLYAGTGIGAARHGGFIPWDDDIDIVMTRQEYDRFYQTWTESPMEGYYLQNTYTDIHCGINHTKIRKDNTILLSKGEDESRGHHGIWIDIFCLEKIDHNLIRKCIVYWHGIKSIILTRGNTYNEYEGFAKRLVKKLLQMIPDDFISKEWNRNEVWFRKHNSIEKDYSWVEMGAGYTFKNLFPMDIPKHYTQIEFEGHKFMMFKDYHTFLTHEFGDYMQLPPEEEQVCRHEPVKIVY